MLTLYNTLGRKKQVFRPVNDRVVNIFTCGPSVYQRAHIGNFRTFLFEDIVVRYLRYRGFRVVRGMNFTDVEDKAVSEALRLKMPLRKMTNATIREFIREMRLLRIAVPEYLCRASEALDGAVAIVKLLLKRGIAYRHGNNIYFNTLTFPRLGVLAGIDSSTWPVPRHRFHNDTYPGMRWNRGDFVLWHGCEGDYDVCWDADIGHGRPAWNIQDASIIRGYIGETLSIYCGGIDNLVRHHDFSIAILESLRPYPMARFWLHGNHLLVGGKKMSKSTGNILYTDNLLGKGYDAGEIRFFLIYGHYRRNLNYADRAMEGAAGKLRAFRERVRSLQLRARRASRARECALSRDVRRTFERAMDDDLNVKAAFDGVAEIIRRPAMDTLTPAEVKAVAGVLDDADSVLQVMKPGKARGASGSGRRRRSAGR